MSERVDEDERKCMTCARFEVRTIDEQARLARYVRFRPPRVGDGKYADRIAELKQRVANNRKFWDEHKQDEHPESVTSPPTAEES